MWSAGYVTHSLHTMDTVSEHQLRAVLEEGRLPWRLLQVPAAATALSEATLVDAHDLQPVLDDIDLIDRRRLLIVDDDDEVRYDTYFADPCAYAIVLGVELLASTLDQGTDLSDQVFESVAAVIGRVHDGEGLVLAIGEAIRRRPDRDWLTAVTVLDQPIRDLLASDPDMLRRVAQLDETVRADLP